jgi:hypothetical protein
MQQSECQTVQGLHNPQQGGGCGECHDRPSDHSSPGSQGTRATFMGVTRHTETATAPNVTNYAKRLNTSHGGVFQRMQTGTSPTLHDAAKGRRPTSRKLNRPDRPDHYPVRPSPHPRKFSLISPAIRRAVKVALRSLSTMSFGRSASMSGTI